MPNANLSRGSGVARDVFAAIEANRTRGALPAARRVAESALREAPYDPDLHDALARVLVDADELQLAADAWETARLIAPGHLGALKGLGFLAFRRGDRVRAEHFLVEALSRSPGDSGVRSALQRLREPRSHAGSASPATLQPHDQPKSVVPDPPATALGTPLAATAHGSASTFVLLCDVDGLVLSGCLGGADGGPLRAQAATEIAALAANIERACHHLGLGRWETCLLDGDAQSFAVGCVGERTLVLSEAEGEGAVGRVLGCVHRDIHRASQIPEGSA